MMDNRKRCDGVGALFCILGSGGVDKIRAFSSVFVYFEGRAASCGGIRANQVAKAASNAHCFGPGGGRSIRRMLFASVHKQVSALRTSVQDWSSVYSSAGITNKLGMRHCIFMKQKSTSANSNVLFKTIQNVCLACKETGPARLGEFHR